MNDKREKNGKERIEPTMGGWDDVEFRSDPWEPVPGWRSRRAWRWTLFVLATVFLVLFLLRKPLADALWPGSQVQQLLQSADAALAAGKLDAADGSGARQLYEAAQALDSDRSEARAGLTRVANAALGQARAALRANRLDEAERALALARELQAPLVETNAVADELRRRDASGAGLDQLLRQAREAQAAGRLDGDPGAALPLYSRILALQPDHTAALEGREDALTDLLQEAKKALAAGEMQRGAALVAAVRGYDPGHIDLPDAQAQLSAALEGAGKRADADLRSGRLERAAAGYRALAEAAGDNVQLAEPAQQGLARVAAAYAGKAHRLAADFRFAEAEEALAQAREIAPQSAEVAAAGQYLQRVRKSHAQEAPATSLSPPSPQRRQRVQALLAQADAAQARGDWLTPPGESAYDRLRAAQALAPGDPGVSAAAKKLLASVRGCFEGGLSANRPVLARTCYDAWAAMAPGEALLATARHRLALKWLAVGDERLGAGDIAFAEQASRQARELDPNTPGLAQFTQRVRDARAGRN